MIKENIFLNIGILKNLAMKRVKDQSNENEAYVPATVIPNLVLIY